MPKGFRKNLSIQPTTFGPEKRQEYLDDIGANGTFLPRAVLEDDMDKAFVDFVTNELSITIEGVKVPVYFFTQQRWSEFTQTWGNTDKFQNMKMPFVSIVRHPDIQEGTNQALKWNIPGKQTYTYYKVPTNDGARLGYDVYKIPQPTAVDITYEVRLFVTRLKETNIMNRKIRKAFNARQKYIGVNGHPMPVLLENTGDESSIDDFNNKRYYLIMYEMMLMGYILDKEDFEIIPTIDRGLVSTKFISNTNYDLSSFESNINEGVATYSFIFKPNSEVQFDFISEFNITFKQLVNIENITRIVITVNDISDNS
jgi:hypothetical protein